MVFLQGYTHAQDRLFQMDVDASPGRRHAGRAASARGRWRATYSCAPSACAAPPSVRCPILSRTCATRSAPMPMASMIMWRAIRCRPNTRRSRSRTFRPWAPVDSLSHHQADRLRPVLRAHRSGSHHAPGAIPGRAAPRRDSTARRCSSKTSTASRPSTMRRRCRTRAHRARTARLGEPSSANGATSVPPMSPVAATLGHERPGVDGSGQGLSRRTCARCRSCKRP